MADSDCPFIPAAEIQTFMAIIEKDFATKNTIKDLRKSMVEHMEKLILFMSDNFKKWADHRVGIVEQDVFDTKQKLDAVSDSKEKLSKDVEEISSKLASSTARENVNEGAASNRQRTLENQEMYSRRDSVRIYNVPHEIDENTTTQALKIIHQNLNLGHITRQCISRSHRVGKPRDNRPAPIIVKFCRHDDKVDVIKARRLLKGKKIGDCRPLVIREDLTQERFGWMHELIQLTSPRQVWSTDGTIVVLVDGDRNYVRDASDYESLKLTLSTQGK